jgi:hypothetical protein
VRPMGGVTARSRRWRTDCFAQLTRAGGPPFCAVLTALTTSGSARFGAASPHSPAPTQMCERFEECVPQAAQGKGPEEGEQPLIGLVVTTLTA